MLHSRQWSGVDLVSPVLGCVGPVEATERGRGACAEIEPLLMMRPPRGSCDFMILIASWVHRNMPVRLVSTTFFQVSYGSSSSGTAGAPMPALLNRTSRRPNASLVLANSAWMEPGSLTSVGATRLLAGLASLAVSSSLSLRRPARTAA